MNSNIEEEIVDSYYQKRCRERIKWELKTPRRRDDGIWKMRLKKYLDEDKMHHLEYLSIEQLKKKILKLGGKETAYLISIYFVGEINIAEGIEKARNDDMGCILYFGNGIGYYHEGELGINPPDFFMLNEVNDKN